MRASIFGCVFSAALVAGAIGGAATAGAGSTVVLGPVIDNSIFNAGAPSSSGAGPSLFSGRTGDFSSPPGVQQRALVRFDVQGAVPPGATIESVTLSLTLLQSSGLYGKPELHTVHRVLAAWGEGTSVALGGSGAPATPGDATWEHTFFPDELWNDAGGDYVAEPSADAIVGTVTPSVVTWGPTPELIADVQHTLAECGSEFGWVIIGNEAETFTAKRFGSREGIASQQPRLTIEYSIPVCPADCGVARNGLADLSDLETLVDQWGGPGSCDLDGCGVGMTDLLELLAAWGPCK